MPAIQRVKYQTNAGSIFNVLLDDSDGIDGLIGTAPGGAYTENMTIRVTKNRKEVGIRPRQILLERTIGTAGSVTNCLIQEAVRYKRVPIPTETKWDSTALNSTVTIGGQSYKVVKKIPEEVL